MDGAISLDVAFRGHDIPAGSTRRDAVIAWGLLLPHMPVRSAFIVGEEFRLGIDLTHQDHLFLGRTHGSAEHALRARNEI